MEKLLLFDIDGTLIDTEGAGLLAFEKGFFAAFPQFRGTPFPPLDLGGATDGSVVAFLFEEFGIENNEAHREPFYAAYLEALKQYLNSFESQGKGRVLDGVGYFLNQLGKQSPHFTSALLTGNTAEGARTKLRHFHLDHHFLFGSYGDDHHDRNELGPIALERAKREHGLLFDSSDTLVIGDTPKDIACARAFGARVIAVATGASSYEDLEEADPDALLTDLKDTERTISTINEILF